VAFFFCVSFVFLVHQRSRWTIAINWLPSSINIPMIIHLQFGFSQFIISFREEDLWNFSQSEHIIGPGSHVEYPTGTKNRIFVEDHPRNIPAKNVLYQVSVFYADRKSKMSVTAGHRLTLDPMGKYSNGFFQKLQIWLKPNCTWMFIGSAMLNIRLERKTETM
jgi:hypothetical protein